MFIPGEFAQKTESKGAKAQKFPLIILLNISKI